MSTDNPYAPPRAAVADIDRSDDVGFQDVKAWSWRGRIGRLRYLAYNSAGYVLLLAASTVLAFITTSLGDKGAVVGIVTGLSILLYIVFVCLLTIQRSHDMNWSGWMSLLAFIPLVGLLWIFKAGSTGGNRFGGPPPPNPLSVKIFAMLMPAVAAIGILAAVAIPAYSQYQQRAHAAQSK